MTMDYGVYDNGIWVGSLGKVKGRWGFKRSHQACLPQDVKVRRFESFAKFKRYAKRLGYVLYSTRDDR